MFNFFKTIFNKKRRLFKRYTQTGLLLGDMLSYSFMGKPVGLEKFIKKYIKLEKEIIKLNLIPLDFIKFVDAGGWGKAIDLHPHSTKDSVDQNKIHQNNLSIIKYYTNICENPDKYYKRIQ